MNFTFKICFLKVVGQFLGNWIPPLLFSDSTSEALLSCIVSFSLFSKSIPSVIQTQLVSSIKKNPFFIPWCLLLTTPQFSVHFTLSLFKSVLHSPSPKLHLPNILQPTPIWLLLPSLHKSAIFKVVVNFHGPNPSATSLSLSHGTSKQHWTHRLYLGTSDIAFSGSPSCLIGLFLSNSCLTPPLPNF